MKRFSKLFGTADKQQPYCKESGIQLNVISTISYPSKISTPNAIYG